MSFVFMGKLKGPRKAHSKRTVQQKFAVTPRTEDGRLDHISAGETQIPQLLSHLLDGCGLNCGIAHDPAFTDQLAADLELRFCQHDDSCARAEFARHPFGSRATLLRKS